MIFSARTEGSFQNRAACILTESGGGLRDAKNGKGFQESHSVSDWQQSRPWGAGCLSQGGAYGRGAVIVVPGRTLPDITIETPQTEQEQNVIARRNLQLQKGPAI